MKQMRHTEKAVHLDRTIGRHRNHRHPRGDAPAGFGQAKVRAQGITCVNNMKQLGLGSMLYAGEIRISYREIRARP